MSDFLCISVAFHDPRFHGQGDGGVPEWPPSPLRLYQAIVAACAARGQLEEAATTLRWLEQQPAPAIIAPLTLPLAPYRIAVPNNDLDVSARYWAKGLDAPKYKNPQDLKSMKTVWPTQFEKGDTVHYLFELSASSSGSVLPHMRALGRAVPSITHLGWGIDMVAARTHTLAIGEAEKLSGRRWKPVAHSTVRLRIPKSGTLEDLLTRHKAFLHRVSAEGFEPVPPLRQFDLVAYADLDELYHRPLASFDLVPIDPDDRRPRKAFRQTDVVKVAAMVRHVAWEAAQSDLGEWRTEQWAEQWVAGHGPRNAIESFPRLSYLPLPSIGHAHADGQIRRVLIAETVGGDGRSAAWCQQRLNGASLHGDNDASAVAVLKSTSESDGVFQAFCPRSGDDWWVSITPVILPGFDGNSLAKREKLILRSFDQAGIPRHVIADFDVQKSPWLRLSEPTAAFNGKRSEHLAHLPACHIRVYFKQAVKGPWAIGAGRHRGLGLLAASSVVS